LAGRSAAGKVEWLEAPKELSSLNLIPAATARLKREDGQAIAEYALVLAAASIVLIGVLTASGLTDEFETLAESVVAALFPD
jgi:Flp pilus assembly pilin Flp